VTQQELRNILKTVMLDELDYIDMHKLADALDGEHIGESKGVMIAVQDAKDSLDNTLRKISRLAVRLGYIPTDTLDKPAIKR
jgi:hypothetical protein